MSQTKTLGGDRLGAGKKMKVHMHGYERSTHDLSYIWRSTMTTGTLVPFISEVALPGDTFDIDLDCDIKTHPTIGPLFGSFKVQLDIFQAPIRLYNAFLHNNALNIGRNMSQIKLPTITLTSKAAGTEITPDNTQINPSCILPYLGIRGVGTSEAARTRTFNAVPLLAYWEIYKNYYSNKQEEIGAVIHTPPVANTETVTNPIVVRNAAGGTQNISNAAIGSTHLYASDYIEITYVATTPKPEEIYFKTVEKGDIPVSQIGTFVSDSGTVLKLVYNGIYGPLTITEWRYRTNTDLQVQPISITTFPLDDIDKMRMEILKHDITVFDIATPDLNPYKLLLATGGTFHAYQATQEGLAIKTYQSDLLNNWVSTEWIDGAGGITEITAIDTSGGSFTLDTLNLSKKVYDMLNRIAVSGGTYDDWLDVVYDHDRYQRCETPMYMGGLIKELVFQEIFSNTQTDQQPLGTLAGKGVMAKKHKGGHSIIKVDEPSYIIGLISLTPRIDYSQGNKWDVHLETMDDFHKPALDQIGFQELITEQMAWWDTHYDDVNNVWVTKSAGKQPAWLNYMTNINRTYANFAIPENEMFMTLNRRFEGLDNGDQYIKDLTTYIDPAKFNFIFAETSIDSQNFWAQIAVNMTVRRKMSAKIMPNL